MLKSDHVWLTFFSKMNVNLATQVSKLMLESVANWTHCIILDKGSHAVNQ